MEQLNLDDNFLNEVTDKIVTSQTLVNDEIIKLITRCRSLTLLTEELLISDKSLKEELASYKKKLKRVKAELKDLQACYDMLSDDLLEPVDCGNDNNEDDTLQGYAIQERCVHCGREQYSLNVLDVSIGRARCTWCHKFSEKMSETEYLDALKKT